MGYAFRLGERRPSSQAGGYLNTGIRRAWICSGHDPYNQPYTNAMKYFLPATIYITALSAEWIAGLLFGCHLQIEKFGLKAPMNWD